MTRKSYSGVAPATDVISPLTTVATTFVVSDATGYPSGSGGPFVVCVDRGTSSEEKILISAVASTTFTVASGGRGYDGTTATTHAGSAILEHVIDAETVDEANDHVNTVSRDDHTQYLNTARHDVTARHAFGSAFATPAAAAAIGTVASAGTATGPSRSDHVHVIGTGAISLANQFAAGVVDTAAIAATAVTSAKIATGAVSLSSQFAASVVDATAIAANAVTTAKILDANVTTAKILDANVTRPKLAAGFTGVTVGTTAPTSPVEGEVWYDTTNDALKAYTTATTGWVAPWNLPWGVIAYGSYAIVQSGITGATETDLTSLTASLPATWPANRRIRITVSLPNVAGNTAYDSFGLRIKESTTTLQQCNYSIASSVLYVNPSVEWIFSPTAGAHTYKAAVIRVAGTGTTDNGAATGSAALFTIEDVGPSGAPA